MTFANALDAMMEHVAQDQCKNPQHVITILREHGYMVTPLERGSPVTTFKCGPECKRVRGHDGPHSRWGFDAVEDS
jgi:hypothetical protein